MFDNFPLWPQQASSNAANVDALYVFLLVLSAAMCVAIFGLILVFAIKFRRRPGVEAEQIEGSTPLELTWSIIPMFIFLFIFGWGAVLYFHERTPPRNATEVYVVAKQWMWKLEHEQGQREINELHLPVGQDVKLVMTSQDVIHSFFVPAFRVKQDVLPGRYTTVWFHPTKAGTYDLYCSQYCGTSHSGMIGKIVVMEPADYEAWLGGGPTVPMAVTGQNLFSQMGCATCHRSDAQGRGPNLVGVFGKPVALEDGRTLTADENYLRQCILNSRGQVVKGYPAIMPVFQGLLSEEQVNSLVAYIKTLSGPQPGQTVKSASATTQPEVKVQ